MFKTQCPICRHLRVLLLALLLGGGGGLLAIWLGASQEVSMLVTFAGGIVPLMWLARQNRISDRDEQ